jgi:hypothetical protein
MFVRMTGDCQQQKHINGGVLPRVPQQVECTALRREQLDADDVGPLLQGMKARQCPKKDRCWGQCGAVARFARMDIDVTGRPPQSLGNGGTHVGFLEWQP